MGESQFKSNDQNQTNPHDLEGNFHQSIKGFQQKCQILIVLDNAFSVLIETFQII